MLLFFLSSSFFVMKRVKERLLQIYLDKAAFPNTKALVKRFLV